MPRTAKSNDQEILVATETFAFGDDVIFAGRTRVTANHPAVVSNPTRFEPVDVTPTIGTIEAATAEPGEKRGQ